MKIFYYLLLFLSLGLYQFVNSQNLLPSITSEEQSNDSDPICAIPYYLGSFYTSGLTEGQVAADFTLYDVNGLRFNLSEQLQSGKPLLIVNGNYTCPVFRNKLPVIEQIQAIYGELLNTIIIYTVEAHPLDTSVYFGYISTGQANISAGILYNQPTTYGERKAIVEDMIADLSIPAPVFIDDACNNWWSVYGPAPNNSYIILPQGTVFSKHGWFDRSPDRILCDLDSLFEMQGNCNQGGNNGISYFTYTELTNDTIYGNPGNTLTYSAKLENTGLFDMQILSRKLLNELPLGWGSSLCLDACYSTTTDSVVFLLPAGESIDFHFYIYTNNLPGTANCRVGFRNSAQNQNSYMIPITGITNETTLEVKNHPINELLIYPNPSSGQVNVNSPHANLSSWTLYNNLGFITDSGKVPLNTQQFLISFRNIPAGIYYMELNSATNKYFKRIAYSPN